jgi:hypothetical protein
MVKSALEAVGNDPVELRRIADSVVSLKVSARKP